MILAIDVGNTNIVLGCIDDQKVYFTERVSTDPAKTELEYAVAVKTVLELYNIRKEDITGAVISSVVPPLNGIFSSAINKLLNVKPIIVGPGVKNGLNILMDNPKQLGADLVVDAVAGIHEYGAPLIIVDMGTATTICVIDRNKNYIGGVIIPGVHVSLDSLTSKTSQLPKISLGHPKKVICTNTIDSMESGMVFGQASCLDGMIERMEAELGYPATVIATGGLAKIIVPHCKRKIILDDSLLLKGLKIIYDKNQ
ncbi:type III pantothenate kinase [bacterium C-53]|nr:type III pantothenate kinase [Lachnospiraceae bacterium]NBI03924.1 type III pantothenate kinase [Lachnospiraceae bacterium]RKJ08873.1 type III pantothenate kinase [bacterium C-53]